MARVSNSNRNSASSPYPIQQPEIPDVQRLGAGQPAASREGGEQSQKGPTIPPAVARRFVSPSVRRCVAGTNAGRLGNRSAEITPRLLE